MNGLYKYSNFITYLKELAEIEMVILATFQSATNFFPIKQIFQVNFHESGTQTFVISAKKLPTVWSVNDGLSGNL